MPSDDSAGALNAAMAIWMRRRYEFGSCRKYMEALDLRSGGGLVAECEEVCPNYGAIVGSARDQIATVMQRWIGMGRGPFQIVILEPDLTPFGIELLDSFFNVRALFEVGDHDLVMKKQLLEEAAPKSISRLKFQVADVGAPDLLYIMTDEGDNDLQEWMPTIILAENASRFTMRSLSRAWQAFGARGRNLVIASYSVPSHDAGTDATLADALASIFRRHCPTWEPHSVGMMQTSMAEIGARCVTHYVLRSAKTGTTVEAIPPGPSDGWARVSLALL